MQFGVRQSPVAPGTVRLSEILGALSHALDLTEGQPRGHCMRATWIGMHLGRQLGLAEESQWELYYAVMMKDLGCSSNAARICELYLMDDLRFKADFKQVDDRLKNVLGFVFTHTGLQAGMADRLRAIANIMRNGSQIVDDLIETRCNRGATIAARLRLPKAVCEGIYSLDEHWNGAGRPGHLAGEAIPLYSRIALLAQVVDVFHKLGGRSAAIAEVEARAGSWFDPKLAAVFGIIAQDESFWSVLEGDELEQAVIDMEPAHEAVAIDDDYLDDISHAFAFVIDSKSSFTAGHSQRVAAYTDAIAAELGYSEARRRWLRRGALLHDIGKLGVSNSILDKNGKLDEEQWIAMRNHTVMSQAILQRVPPFRTLARIGGRHHERLDGKGYPLGLQGAAIDFDTRIVSVADVFDALTADRPYRAALPITKALDIMRADVGTAFDRDCFAALQCTFFVREATCAVAA